MHVKIDAKLLSTDLQPVMLIFLFLSGFCSQGADHFGGGKRQVRPLDTACFVDCTNTSMLMVSVDITSLEVYRRVFSGFPSDEWIHVHGTDAHVEAHIDSQT